ncbi:MAG: SET domain-containing protein-lysine N-methyltransferase [Anaerolineae bacterium]|nr:SET domain-containing protein-lysine N-methyltransferase [Anaerolineae bacterium]
MPIIDNSYVHENLEARPHPQKGHWGLFARAFTPADTVLIVWGGPIVDEAGLAALPRQVRHYAIQVEEGLYQVTVGSGSVADYLNHSCDPNAGFAGQIVVVAMRDIYPDEEVCVDYAMCDGSPYDEFDCACGSPNCRGRVTGEDWRRPDLQQRYAGYFMPYLQRRIDRLQSVARER